MAFKRRPPQGDVRRVVSTGKNIRGVVTNKAGRIVQFESWNERTLLLRLDRDPNVKDYASQPEVFEYVDPQGKKHQYTPDFIVWQVNNQTEIHEVSTSQQRKRSNIYQREMAGERICRERGWLYIVHTEKSLPRGTELANLLALYRYRPSCYTNQLVADFVIEQLSQGGPRQMHNLITQVATILDIPQPESIITGILGHMLWHGQISTDLQSKLLFDIDCEFATGVKIWLA